MKTAPIKTLVLVILVAIAFALNIPGDDGNAQHHVTLSCLHKASKGVGSVGVMGADGTFGFGENRVYFEFLGHRDGADQYEIVWKAPGGKETATTIAFEGESITIFENDKIIISAEP